jgi:hypothetical protein
MAAAKVEIIYEAEATSLKAVVNEVNKTNSEIVSSAKQTATKFGDEFKNASKSAAQAFGNGQISGAIKSLNTQFNSLTTGLKLNTDAFKKFDVEVQKTNQIIVNSSQDVAKYEDRLRELSVAGQRATQEFEDIAKAVGEYKSAIIAADRAVDLYAKSTDAATGRIGELEDKLYDLALAGQSNTQEFKDLVREVANVKRAIVETDAQIDSFVDRSRGFGTVVQNIELVGNAFQVVEGAAALFGDENEELQKTLVKLQAITAITSGLEQARLALIEQSAKKTGIAAIAQKGYNLVVGTSTGALKAFRLALAATGIGALVVGIVLLIENFDKLKDAIRGTSDSSRLLDGTLEDTRTALAGAIEETNKVESAFELARKGVISKEEALFTYNETLGDTFGKTNDLNKAEENYNNKKDAYIQATAARAKANALLAKSAQLAAEAATLTPDDAKGFGEQYVTFINDAAAGFLGLFGTATESGVKFFDQITETIDTKAVDRVKKEKETQSQLAQNLAQSEGERAEIIEKGAGLLSEAEQKFLADREAKRKAAAEKAKAEAEKAAQDQLKAREQLAALEIEALDSQLGEQEKILEQSNKQIQALEKSFRESNFKEGSEEQIEQQKKLTDAIELIKLQANKQITAIEIAELEKSLQKQLELSKAGADATLQQQLAALQIQQTLELETADKLGKSKVEIANKYAPQIEAINKQIAAAELNTQINTIKTLEIEQGSTLDRRIELINIEAEARRKAATDSIKDEKERASAIELINAETEAAIREERKKTREQTIDDAFEIADETLKVLGSILDLQKQVSDNRIADVERTRDAEIEAINQSTDLESNKIRQREAAEFRAQRAIAAEKTKQAKRDKAAAIIQATIDTALAVIKSVSASPTTFGLPFSAFALATGAAQIALIAAQPIPKFKKGGIVGGRSHEAGGTMIEAEKGEFVVNRSSVARHRDALDAMNRSSAAFKKYVDERYVRPALMDFAAKNRGSNVTVNASLNSKSMEREIKGLRKDLKGKSTVVNINSYDSRYLWQ